MKQFEIALILRLGLAAVWCPAALHAAEAGRVNWPLFRGTPQLTGVADTTLPDHLALAWTVATGDAIRSSPVVADGRVFFGSEDGKLYAVGIEHGKHLWTHDAGAPVNTPPLVVRNLVIAGTDDGAVLALNAASGTVKWTFQAKDKIRGGANVIRRNGAIVGIVVGSYDMNLYCLDLKNGKPLWIFATDNYINNTPAINDAGIVFGGCDGLLHVVNPRDGKEIRHLDAGSYVAASTAIRGHRAWLGQFDGNVLCADLQRGTVLWTYTPGKQAEPFFSPPAVDANYVIIGSRDRFLRCLDRNTGAIRWKFRTGGQLEGGAVIAGAKVVFGSGDGRLYLLDLATGKELWSYEIGAALSTCPAVADKKILIGCDDGALYAFKMAPETD